MGSNYIAAVAGSSILAPMPTIRFLPGEKLLEVPRGRLLIEAIRDAEFPIASSCGDDLACARCGVRILAGRVNREAPIERDAKQRNRVDPELRLACAVRVHHDLEITADYWGPL